MKEELLIFLREELERIKVENTKYNEKVKRIKELEKDPKIREYINLLEIEKSNLKQIKLSDKQIILSFYHNYIYKIQKQETNGIYVYLGTYKYNHEIDIVHGSSDNRVEYNSKKADYRIYKNIEQNLDASIARNECNNFEKEHIIIYPEDGLNILEYYKIRDDFFVKAIKTNQESAKKLILKKYNTKKN